MLDDLLVVFSNYNGMRTKNDIRHPRIKMCIESFRNQVPYWKDVNALLLDNNSNDGSDKLMESYAGSKWVYRKKVQEDYYLGTLCKLLNEFENKYKYIMVIDNDQYFVRPNFLPTIVGIFDKHTDIVCVQAHESTYADFLDHATPPSKRKQLRDPISGVWDYVSVVNNDVWLRSSCFNDKDKFYEPMSPDRGGGRIFFPRRYPRRVCWLWFAFSNTVLRISHIKPLFERYELMPPYLRNSDRMAIFSFNVGQVGRTAYLARGASINIGHRKRLPKSYSLRKLIAEYEKENKGMYVDNRFSFYHRKNKLRSIERQVRRAQEKNNM